MARATPHLSDLFRVGEVVTVEDSDDNEYRIYIRRPSPMQQDRAREKANGRSGRHKIEARNPNSDIYASMHAMLADQERESLLESRILFDEPEVRDIAFNEVLYDESVGDDWSEDDRYMTALAGLTGRLQDISKYNDEMEESGSDDRIVEEEDEALQTYQKEYDLFQLQVKERSEKLLADKTSSMGGMSDDEIREDIMKSTVDLEARMAWYEEYQVNMLYYACRFPDDKKKLYFGEPSEVLEVPIYIRKQLFDAYERLEAGSDDLKNSLSLHSS